MDGGLKEREAAKAGTELQIATNESALGDLNDAMDRNMGDLARLAEDYAGLSLLRPFEAHM